MNIFCANMRINLSSLTASMPQLRCKILDLTKSTFQCSEIVILYILFLSIINYQLSIINYQLLIINYQLLIINYQLSIINYQLSFLPNLQNPQPINRLILQGVKCTVNFLQIPMSQYRYPHPTSGRVLDRTKAKIS